MITAIVYFSLGALFTYIAIHSGDNLWSTRTILPTIIAAIDIGVSIRLLRKYYQLKRYKSSSKKRP